MLNNTIFSLHNKVVLITGGTGYLGSSMSEILSECGATLIIASRNQIKNQALKENLKEKYNNEILCLDLDIGSKTSVKNCIENILEKYGRIDVLINNSYYGAGKELLSSMDEEEWLKGIDGSINGVFRVTKSVLTSMVKKNYGRIINIASMYGKVAPDVSIYEGNNYYNPANYGVGKAGIIHFTKYIASVYGRHGVTCNTISPGPFPSLEVQKDEEFIQSLNNKVPLRRIGSPDELKGVIALLASDASSYINGANISVDGGWTIW